MSFNYNQVVKDAKEAFESRRTFDINFRKDQLKRLQKLCLDNAQAVCQALHEDLRKPRQESMLAEVSVLVEDINFILRNLDEWTQVENPGVTATTVLDKSKIYQDPYGVVLVIGAWNYPFQLTLLPVAGAIAAGNCVVIKPSELSPATAKLIETLVPKYLDQDCFKVICGGIEETTALLKERFDYIFFTGSPRIGKIVRAAANEHLTPTTLELGGKSPAFLDDTVDMEMAVKRLLWGKLMNLGQTCIAPDYLLCSRKVQGEFIDLAKKIIKEWYTDDPQKSPDLGRIVNERNFQRVREYLKDGTIAIGGKSDPDDKWIEPTILIDVPLESKVMQDEIFGPILPIINVDSAYDAIRIIKSREKPLALYVLSTNEDRINQFMRETSAGGCAVNDTIVHTAVTCLPFGGVGGSGIGAYHGKSSYDTFTHKKSVLHKSYNPITERLGNARYPPYSAEKTKMIGKFIKDRKFPPISFATLMNMAAFGLGALSIIVMQQINKMSDEESVSTPQLDL